jgi:hypothetical protein
MMTSCIPLRIFHETTLWGECLFVCLFLS